MEPVSHDTVTFTLLGRGFSSLTLLKHSDEGVAPDDPRAPLLISLGLLTGAGAPSAARVQVSARSPLTTLLGTSSVGGKVGAALRLNGIHAIEIVGRSHVPCYLWIADGQIELRDAIHLWGLTTEEATRRIMQEHADDGLAMLLIGPAGERQVPIACVTTQRGHAAGRTGMGAVMGSKNLKAIVVADRGEKARLGAEGRVASRSYAKRIMAAEAYEAWSEHGNTGVKWADDKRLLSTYNYTGDTFEGAAAVDGRSMAPYVLRRRSCRPCPVHCKAELRISEGPYAGTEGERPEFEPLVSWGPKVGLDDPEAVIYLTHLCDLLGLDSVSAGNAVAFALDLYQRRVIDAGDTEGLELRWGDATAMERLLRQMVSGEALGGVLGLGVRRAAVRIGRGAERYAFHVKGLELSAYDPRAAQGAGLGFAVSTRGGDFTGAYPRHEESMTPADARVVYGDARAADSRSPFGKAAMVRRGSVASAALDCLGICKFTALSIMDDYDLRDEAELVRAVTGLDITVDYLQEVGERVLAAERLVNARFGATPEDDLLPAVFLEEPLVGEDGSGTTIDVRPMLAEYYRIMGWSPRGVPTADLEERLGLSSWLNDNRPDS
jgi:aldehyde:ferredoxin oxidoreductase